MVSPYLRLKGLAGTSIERNKEKEAVGEMKPHTPHDRARFAVHAAMATRNLLQGFGFQVGMLQLRLTSVNLGAKQRARAHQMGAPK